MTTKKKTTKTTTPKRSPQWWATYTAAITGLASNPEFATIDTNTEDLTDAEMVHDAADIVRRAEKIADIATGRNA